MSCWMAIDLACRRGPRLLFQGLGFELRAGQLGWVQGRNGSGKTSLLRLVAGLGRPEAGELRHDGRALQPGSPRPVCFIGHACALSDELSAHEALAFLTHLHGRPASDDALAQALEAWGLAPQRGAPVRTLSQGQRRRLALARLSLPPAADAHTLWLLDEPFEALDAQGIALAHDAMHAHLGRGGGVLLSAHTGLEAMRLAPIPIALEAA